VEAALHFCRKGNGHVSVEAAMAAAMAVVAVVAGMVAVAAVVVTKNA
jgi:hypothetical protein